MGAGHATDQRVEEPEVGVDEARQVVLLVPPLSEIVTKSLQRADGICVGLCAELSNFRFNIVVLTSIS